MEVKCVSRLVDFFFDLLCKCFATYEVDFCISDESSAKTQVITWKTPAVRGLL